MTDLVVEDISKPITIEIEETEAPEGYKKLEGIITVTLTRSGSTYKVSATKASSISDNEFKADDAKFENNILSISIKEIPVLEELNLLKIDSSDKTGLKGAEFKIDFSNVKSYKDGAEIKTDTTLTKSTSDGGKLLIEDLIINDISKEATITIEETKAPDGYKKINGKIYLKINYTDDGYTITATKDSTIDSSEFEASDASIKDKKYAIVKIKDMQIITLSGQVWLDGQKGEKEANVANGEKDKGESRLEGVLVQLYKADTNKQVTKNVNGEDISNVKTDKNGNYSFENIEKTKDGYYIKFSYDGINYQETKSIGSAGTDSQANETPSTRQTFNSNFKTISKAQSNNRTPLEYDYIDNKSILKVNMDGTNPANRNAEDFRMTAQTGVYKETTENIDCGLVKKEFDLAIGTDIKSAELKINDKSTTYNYAQIMNRETDFQNKSSDVSDIVYNLYLYKSDYNYRIEDYKTGNEAINNTVNPDDNTVNNYDDLKKLEANVTYSVILENQTTYESTVEQFVYYYDSIYEPYNIVSTNKYDISIDETARKITFTSKSNGFKLTAPDYRAEVELTFKVKEDADYIILKDNISNVAEITKYSTDIGGLIDKDSAPDNANVTFTTEGTPKVGQYEDDTDEAPGLNTAIDNSKVRTITGTVFDDGNFNGADGMKQDGENAVNDVIVQLIEIKKISGNYYEYIWQETRSGSNQVKTTARNGYAGETYTNSVAEGSGMYEFKDFIPGNYIIRFIYGDGTTYDITTDEYKDSAENVKTYNGQDYKSTKDANYNKAWYNTAEYTDGQSVARDNEARRLEVMAYSTTINKTIGEEINQKTKTMLDKTWMCAETSRINVPIDADDKATDENSTTASYNYTKNNTKVIFDNVNFGLALRPETKLVLEKHITGLKITPTGVGVQPIVDARANIEDILGIEGAGTITTAGITKGLAAMKSTRGNRTSWKVETDIEELAQGATLEVEYTYVIKDESDVDYLSKILINAYKGYQTNDDGTISEAALGMSYPDYLKSLKYDTRGRTHLYGTYLGTFYYTGEANEETDKPLLSRVETFEESLNNDLGFDESTSGTYFKQTGSNVNKTIYNTGGNSGGITIAKVIQNTNPTDFLKTGNKDFSKRILLKSTLAASSEGITIPSYIAEIVEYTNAAGRRDMESEPGNLSYVHSDDTNMTLDAYKYELDSTIYYGTPVPGGATNVVKLNEEDEFWGETIIISKPTGENKQAPMQIAIIAISSIAVLGVGIVLIKKFVLKK